MGVEPFGFGGDFFHRKIGDFEMGDFGLQFRKFGKQLVKAFLAWFVEFAEALGGDLAIQKEPMSAGHIVAHLLDVAAQGVEKRLFVSQVLVGFLEVGGDPLGRGKERFQFFMDDSLQVDNGDFVPTLFADILGRAGVDIHALAAGAKGQAGKKLDGRFAGAFGDLLLLFENLVALFPKGFRNDGIDGNDAPFAFGLFFPLPIAGLAGAVEVIHPFGAGAAENACEGYVTPFRPSTGAVAGFVELACHHALAAVLEEKFVGELADGGVLGMNEQVLVLPMVAIGGHAADGFAEFGPNRKRCLHAIGDFLSLPLGHGRDDGEKQPSRGSRGVDGLGDGNEVGLVTAEVIGEFEEFLGVTGKSGKLGKNEAGDEALFSRRGASVGPPGDP